MAEPFLAAPALIAYPNLWGRSLALQPFSWRDQFRVLCGLAKAFTWHPTVPLSLLPEGECLLIRALATVDVEMYLLEMLAAFPTEPNPMVRLDPCGVGLVAPDDAAAGQPPAGVAGPAKAA